MIALFHGSQMIIDTKHNDYGKGFYCTENIQLAEEWAVSSLHTPDARPCRKYLIEHFGNNVNAYDIVIGYRADDSYFEYAEV